MIPGITDARLEEQPLADRMDRDLKDPREPVPFPGIERKVVVAELEVGRIEIAEVFELVVQAAAPAAVRGRERHRLEARAPEDPVGAFQVDPIGFGLAIDVMEMPVRLRVVLPQVGEDRRMMGIGMRADESACSTRPAAHAPRRSGGSRRAPAHRGRPGS